MTDVDLEPTLRLAKLLYMPPEKRDLRWQKKVSDLAWNCPLQTASSQWFRADDSFVYYGLYFPKPPFSEPAYLGSIIDWLIEHKVGVAIGAGPEKILYYLDQGSILGYKLYGSTCFRWEGDYAKAAELRTLTEVESVLITQPTEEILPPLARDYMRYLLKDLYLIETPKVLLYQVENRPWELVFNVFPEDFMSESMFQGAMANVIRFLPPPQKPRVIFMHKDSVDPNLFQPF